MVPLVNTVMLTIIFVRFGFKYAVTRLMCGEILSLYLYWLWFCVFPQSELLYVIPMMLSIIGKTYLMVTPAMSLEVDAVENLILMQSKIEMIIMIHHFLKCLFFGTQARAVEFIVLITLLKLKYSLHYGTRKAY